MPQTQPPVRQIGPIVAVANVPLSNVASVRQLSDGRVYAADNTAHRLLLFEASPKSATTPSRDSALLGKKNPPKPRPPQGWKMSHWQPRQLPTKNSPVVLPPTLPSHHRTPALTHRRRLVRSAQELHGVVRADRLPAGQGPANGRADARADLTLLLSGVDPACSRLRRWWQPARPRSALFLSSRAASRTWKRRIAASSCGCRPCGSGWGARLLRGAPRSRQPACSRYFPPSACPSRPPHRGRALSAAARDGPARRRGDDARWIPRSLREGVALPPKLALGIAIGHLLGQHASLGRCVTTPGAYLDNDGAENSIRPFKVGAKNGSSSGIPPPTPASPTSSRWWRTAVRRGSTPKCI